MQIRLTHFLTIGLLSLSFLSLTVAPAQAIPSATQTDLQPVKAQNPSKRSNFGQRWIATSKLTLTLRQGNGLTAKGDSIRWNPYAGVRRGHYRIYRFTRNHFVKHLGPWKTFRRARVTVVTTAQQKKTHEVPAGTIHTTVYDCKITKVHSVKNATPTTRKADDAKTPPIKTGAKTFALPRERKQLARKMAGNAGSQRAIIQLRSVASLMQRTASRQLLVHLGSNTRRGAKPSAFYRLTLSKKELRKYTGDKKDVTLVLKIKSLKTHRHTPPPNMPSPSGGFTYYTFHATILSAK